MLGEPLGPGLDLAVDLVPEKIVDPAARKPAPQKGGDKDACDNDSEHLKAKGVDYFRDPISSSGRWFRDRRCFLDSIFNHNLSTIS